MQKRNPFVVLLLSIVTFGIYGIYWSVVTKIEANKTGAQIPTAWLLIIPLVNIYWYWKLAEGLGHVTNQQVSPIAVFLLIFFLGTLGMVVVQFMLNGVAVQPQTAPVAADPAIATSIPISDEPTPPLGPTPPTAPTPPTPPTPPQAPTPPTTPPATPPAAPVV